MYIFKSNVTILKTKVLIFKRVQSFLRGKVSSNLITNIAILDVMWNLVKFSPVNGRFHVCDVVVTPATKLEAEGPVGRHLGTTDRLEIIIINDWFTLNNN